MSEGYHWTPDFETLGRSSPHIDQISSSGTDLLMRVRARVRVLGPVQEDDLCLCQSGWFVQGEKKSGLLEGRVVFF